MTKAEFTSLKKHARIKYIGTRPAQDLFVPYHDKSCTKGKTTSGWGYGRGGCNWNCTDEESMPKTFEKKGVVVQYVGDDSPNNNIYLMYYGGKINGIVPAEWALLDARKWVESETEYKMAKSYVPQVARRFKAETKNFLATYKRRIDYKLESLPLDKKLKLIMELSPEDKKWFGILNTDPDEVISLIEKAFENNDL